MAGVLESLARGLRQAGGIISPDAQKQLAAEDMAAQQERRQIAQVMLADRLQREREGVRLASETASRAEDRKSREALARETLAQRAEDSVARVQSAKDNATMLHEFRMAQLKTNEERAAETARHNKVLEGLTAQQNAITNHFKTLGLAGEAQGKPPAGYRWKKGQPGVLEPIPGGPATVLNPEQAAKTELLNNGIKDVERYRDLVLKDGKVDRQIILGMATPGMAGVPGTNSRLAYSYIYNAIEAKLRAESGAAVPESEVQRMAKRFVPSPLDNDETIKSKVARLDEFLRGSLGRVKGQPGAGTGQPPDNDPLGIRGK